MLKSRWSLDQQELTLVINENFVVSLYSLLQHIFKELIFNETRWGNYHTFYYTEVNMPKNALHNCLIEFCQTLKMHINNIKRPFINYVTLWVEVVWYYSQIITWLYMYGITNIFNLNFNSNEKIYYNFSSYYNYTKRTSSIIL